MTTVNNAYQRAMAWYMQHLNAEESNRLRLPTTLSELVRQAQAMENVLSTEHQKGRTSVSRAIGEKAILLEPFEKLVEGLCKTSPAAGELIWGSVSFILQMPRSHVKTFDEVSNFFQTMADAIGQIRLREATFAHSPLVQLVVETLYSAVIDFWVDAVKYYHLKQSGTKRSYFYSGKWNSFLVVGLGSRLKLYAWSPSIDKKFQLLMEEIVKQRSRLHDASSAQHNADFASFKLRERSSHRRRLRDWLNASDYSSDFRVAIDRYYGGTCEWILQKPSFIKWRLSTSTPTLFIHGIPGAGKTILSSWVIARALRFTADTTLVLYHYFKHTDTDKRTDVSAVRSFIDQLFNHFRCTQHPLLSQLESKLNAASLEQRHTNFSELWPIFSTTLSNVAQAQVGLRITVIMDAMDECDSAQKLTTNILNLAHQIPKNLKVLFTGRKSAWDLLDNSLSTSSLLPLELEITPEDVHHDINTFVRHTISKIPRLAAHEHLRDRLSEVIGSVENHQGMFLWAYFICEEVKRQGDVRMLWRLLDHLPRGLDAMYQPIYKTIAERDEEPGLSLSVLRWIVNRPRPLQFPELQEGLRLMRAANEDQYLRSDVWFDGSSDLHHARLELLTSMHLTGAAPAPIPTAHPPAYFPPPCQPPTKRQRTGYATEAFSQNTSEEYVIFGPCGHGPISREDAKRIAFAALQMYGGKFKAADIRNAMAIRSMPGFVSIRFREYAKAHLFVFSVNVKPPYPHQSACFVRTSTEYTDEPLSVLQGILPTTRITDPSST
ncbi:hypothetical protein DXG01_012466 [Tephrocybe rancida]|nr:hypothetical protein DXG01_012466 [Tephrocybe rancida]